MKQLAIQGIMQVMFCFPCLPNFALCNIQVLADFTYSILMKQEKSKQILFTTRFNKHFIKQNLSLV